jgi:hypothetical protein
MLPIDAGGHCRFVIDRVPLEKLPGVEGLNDAT